MMIQNNSSKLQPKKLLSVMWFNPQQTHSEKCTDASNISIIHSSQVSQQLNPRQHQKQITSAAHFHLLEFLT